jgi:hypothetical protein
MNELAVVSLNHEGTAGTVVAADSNLCFVLVLHTVVCMHHCYAVQQ